MNEERTPLTYKRETLIASLEASLKETQDKREEQRQKDLEKRQAVIDAITKALENPQFVMALVGALQYRLGSGFDPNQPEAFAATVERTWPIQSEGQYDPDQGIKRLIRVYEKAEDTEVKVAVTDEVYFYL